MKLVLLSVMIFLFGFLAYSPASSESKTTRKEPQWKEIYHPDRTQSFYFNQEKQEGDVVVGQMLVIYKTPKMYSGKSYISRVTGVTINCKQSAFVMVYDLYYQLKFPGLYDNAIGMVQHDLSKSSVINGNSNLVYQSFCIPLV